jgi:outer membrane lipoprotein-sorting protein
MKTRKSLLPLVMLPFLAASAAAAETNAEASRLTAAQIAERNIAARGGLAAWHAIRTMSWSGKLDAGTGDSTLRSEEYVSEALPAKPRKKAEQAAAAAKAAQAAAAKQIQLPFVLDMKRPDLSRVEVVFAGKTAVQIYDGSHGWMLRPFLNRDDWEPFTPEQMKASAGKWRMDGPLLDYAANDTKLTLEGMEPVTGHDAYKLKLILKDGSVEHVWVDAKTFLDVKVEGTPRRMDDKLRDVWIYQSDFRKVDGVMVPYVLETAVDGYRDTHKMTIDKVSVNPALSDDLFKPSGA